MPNMQRRTYLQVVGAGAVSTAAASPAEATEHTGYGDSGYGEIPYGGSDDSDDSDDTDDGDDTNDGDNGDDTDDGGNGDGGDGDDTDDGDGTDTEIGDPVVDHLSLSDVSPPNPHVELVTEWVVSHPDGELGDIEIMIRTDAGGRVDTIAQTVSGERAEGTEETEIKKGAGDVYVVTLFVTDSAGNTDSEMEALETAR